MHGRKHALICTYNGFKNTFMIKQSSKYGSVKIFHIKNVQFSVVLNETSVVNPLKTDPHFE